MIYVLAVVLGLIQALTEFLPVSSSAHLILARAVLDFSIADGLAFDVGLHIGTLVAIVVYFRRDVAMLARGILGWGAPNGATPSRNAEVEIEGAVGRRLAWSIVAASVPAALAGLLFENAIETYVRNPAVIVFTLVAGGVLFLIVERAPRRTRGLESLGFGGAMWIGVAQALALVPGVSRSGITIAVGLARGLRREQAARFSFLLGAPALFGAGLKKSLDLAGQTMLPGEVGVFLVGAVASGVAGWFVVRFLLNFLQNHRLDVFAWYRIALAGVVAAYLLLGRAA